MAKKPTQKKEAHRFQIVIDPELIAKLDEEAEETDRSRMAMIRWILRERYGLIKKSGNETRRALVEDGKE